MDKMVNPAGKIERLMVHRPTERFMVYEPPVCVIIAPNEDGSLRIDAFGGEEIHKQGLDERILHDPLAPHTDLILYLCGVVEEAKTKGEAVIGGPITPLLYPEVGIEYAYALKLNGRADDRSFIQIFALSRGLQVARDTELEHIKQEKLRRHEETQRLRQY